MTEFQHTPIEEIEKIHQELRAGYESGKLKPIAYRKYAVLQLGYLVQDNAKQFSEALFADLGRPASESELCDIGPSIGEAKHTYHNLEKWASPEKPAFSLTFGPMKRVIYKEPKGVVLIISPFNYPLWLSLGPVISAVAAGNTVVLKPSEQTPATSALLAELMPKYVDPSLVRVVNGAVAETTKLLELPWGHVLYTGGGRVGKIIAAAAAKTLTPVSLELGGKSPVFIDPNCNLENAARRIWWGKVVNAGQTCVAPDYVLVPKTFQDKFVEALKMAHEKFYPDSTSITAPGNYARIVSPQAYSRIAKLLKNTNGKVVFGGETDEATKYIAPTIVTDVKFDDSLMSEEIFGPILPIIPIENVDEGINYVNAHDHPLSLYVFSNDTQYKQKVFSLTESGSAIANDTIIHPGVEGIPFGGVGPSGNGYHTGKYGFDMFTHMRASLDNPSWVDKIMGFRYPPYSESKLKAMKRVTMASLPTRPKGPPGVKTSGSSSKWWLFILIAAVTAALTKRLKSVKGSPS